MTGLRVISGGQTGVDRGGLEAALKLGIAIGGFAPLGWRAEDGVIPMKFRRHMQMMGDANYRLRTERNVLLSDATLIYSGDCMASPGTRFTIDICKKEKKPWFDVVSEINIFQEEEDGYWHMAKMLESFSVLNVAGPRESGTPGIQEASRDRFLEIFRRIMVVRTEHDH